MMDYHTVVSFIKSIIRIIGFIVLMKYLFAGAMILIFAEILGILEEAE